MTAPPDASDTEAAALAQPKQLTLDTTPAAPESVEMSGTDLPVALR